MPLPCTKEELQSIEKHVPRDSLIRLGVENIPATVQDVLSHLSSSHAVHFACHGKQDANDPLESGLVLHDGHRLRIKEIMNHSMPYASLAFLSACETAMGAENLPDEAMHLAASLLFAGFQGVVATMWQVIFILFPRCLTYCKCCRSIADEDGPKIADRFYEYLFRSVLTNTRAYPDTTDAAHALHHAVAKLRADSNCSFKRWVPFIHMGL
jgi:hypothetical protein